MVGRVAPEKNFDLAMTTFEQMRQAFPDVRCVVVGDGPLREKLAVKFPWVRFAGVQTGEDLARHYASADVLVFPSETETFGNVLLEAMASGLATVSFDYAASALHVRSGENGLKAAKGDSAGFIRHAVDALSLRPDDELREAARETAESLGWDQVVDEFERRLAEISGAADEVPAARPKKSQTPEVFLPHRVSIRHPPRHAGQQGGRSRGVPQTHQVPQAGAQRRHHRRLGAEARRTLDIAPQPRDPQGHQDDRAATTPR